MNITLEFVKTKEAINLSLPVVVSLLHTEGLWKIEVPDFFDNSEIILNQLSIAKTPDELVNKYASALETLFAMYNYNKSWDRVKHRFLCTQSTAINDAVILSSSVEITSDFSRFGIKRKSWYGDNYPYRGFGTVINNQLISWCIENSHYLDPLSTVIGVGTDSKFRRKSFASSNVAALCKNLIESGISNVYYECDLNNTASYNTAKKVNLDYSGKLYYLGFTK